MNDDIPSDVSAFFQGACFQVNLVSGLLGALESVTSGRLAFDSFGVDSHLVAIRPETCVVEDESVGSLYELPTDVFESYVHQWHTSLLVAEESGDAETEDTNVVFPLRVAKRSDNMWSPVLPLAYLSVGGFIYSVCYRIDSTNRILHSVEDVLSGYMQCVEDGMNCDRVTITPETCVFENDMDEDMTCEMPTKLFERILREWREILKSCPKSQ